MDFVTSEYYLLFLPIVFLLTFTVGKRLVFHCPTLFAELGVYAKRVDK